MYLCARNENFCLSMSVSVSVSITDSERARYIVNYILLITIVLINQDIYYPTTILIVFPTIAITQRFLLLLSAAALSRTGTARARSLLSKLRWSSSSIKTSGPFSLWSHGVWSRFKAASRAARGPLIKNGELAMVSSRWTLFPV